MLFHVVFEQLLPLEEHLGALLDGQPAPRSGYALWADSMAASTSAAVQHGALREHLAGARVGHVHVFVGGRLAPLAVDHVAECLDLRDGLRHCSSFRAQWCRKYRGQSGNKRDLYQFKSSSWSSNRLHYTVVSSALAAGTRTQDTAYFRWPHASDLGLSARLTVKRTHRACMGATCVPCRALRKSLEHTDRVYHLPRASLRKGCEAHAVVQSLAATRPGRSRCQTMWWYSSVRPASRLGSQLVYAKSNAEPSSSLARCAAACPWQVAILQWRFGLLWNISDACFALPYEIRAMWNISLRQCTPALQRGGISPRPAPTASP